MIFCYVGNIFVLLLIENVVILRNGNSFYLII